MHAYRSLAINWPLRSSLTISSDCRQDEYFAQLGQCIETPGSSLAQRKTTFVTLNGRQCLKTKSMLATNSTITLPCGTNSTRHPLPQKLSDPVTELATAFPVLII